MSRRRAAVKRTLLKDPKYNDTLVSKFVCSLMKHGKKSVAERILYGALDLISDREKETPSLDVFRTAVENVKPAMEVCLLYTSPSPRDGLLSRMPSSA